MILAEPQPTFFTRLFTNHTSLTDCSEQPAQRPEQDSLTYITQITTTSNITITQLPNVKYDKSQLGQ